MPEDVIRQRLSEIDAARNDLTVQSEELKWLEHLKSEAEELNAKKTDLCKELDEMEKAREAAVTDSVQQKELELRIAKIQAMVKSITSDFEKVGKQIEAQTVFLYRKKRFNKTILFQNIRELLKTSDVKLGQIEREAGCQPGYMSRLEKAENTTDPTVEFLVTASEMLGVSADILMNVVLSELTPTEKYLISFLEKLVKDTVADKLVWNTETEDFLNFQEPDINGYVEHPLFNVTELEEFSSDGSFRDITDVVFNSKAYGIHTVINGDCYNLRMKNGVYLYIMNVCGRGAGSRAPFIVEIWMYRPQSPASFLCDNSGNGIISKCVADLYSVVSKNVKHPKVSKDLKYIIDAFMADDLDDDSSDGLPF